MNSKPFLCVFILIVLQGSSYAQSTLDHKKNTVNSTIQNSLKINPDFGDEKIEISFNLDKQSFVNIKITDLLGNEPFSLLNERLTSGEFKRNFNIPTKLAKGVYFIKVNAGNELIIRRISVQ
jgi:hypothetical protein